MHNREKEKIIYNLIKIESVLAKLYTRFSTRKNFTAPVKKFWASIAGEEEIHADILDKILQALKDDNINIDIDIRIEDLKKFILKTNEILKKASSDDLTESDAYSLGATIEEEFDESGFTKVIKTNDENLNKLLKNVENDTKKHRILLINYSRGVR